MVKIGLLSDTHGHLDEKMLNFFKSVDEIWHAGDIGNIELIDKLKHFKKVRAVTGNIDNHLLRQDYQEISIFTIEKLKVVMTHIGGYPPKYDAGMKILLRKERPGLFISGHSHILKVIFDKELNLLHINPGAAGIQGFHLLRTMVRFEITDGIMKNLEVWEFKR
ncbi:MAG: metallophosphoesterase family protein [Salinivirgaceae bacterium]|jgi:putative phosphoesterase|nr:metallophosphoesterase family protein [Salinivirgaceae bacterium]